MTAPTPTPDARTIPRIRVCTRRFGFFLLATDPADPKFHMTSEVVGSRADADAMKDAREGKLFVPSDWTRNPRAVRLDALFAS